VGYLRFASVYRGFSSLEDFEREIAWLRGGHEPEWLSPVLVGAAPA